MEIRTQNFKIDLHGFSGTSTNKDYQKTALDLMDKMWKIVREKNLKNKGLNVFIYDQNEEVFAGVELLETPDLGTGLELKKIDLSKYAYYKHVGPYNLIKQIGQNMRLELKNEGLDVTFPYIEIYGHWTNDESRLETELLMCLK